MADDRKLLPEIDDGPPSGVLGHVRFSGATGRRSEDVPEAPGLGDWTWTHLGLGDVRAMALLRAEDALPADAFELFHTGETRVQVREADGWVFGVLPDLERDLVGRPQGPGRLAFAFNVGQLITGRLHPLLAIDDLRHAAEKGDAFPSPAAAVADYIQAYVDRVEAALDERSQELAAVEDYVLTEPQAPRETGLSAIRREVARTRRELQGLRSALARAHVSRRPDRRVTALEEGLAELIAAVDDVDRDAGVLQDRARLLHEEIDTLINSATNRSMRVLTIISTLLIPPTLVTGAFGMNVPGIPFEHDASGFLVAAALCALVVGGAFLLMRRLGM